MGLPSRKRARLAEEGDDNNEKRDGERSDERKSEVEKNFALEHQKLTEMRDPEIQQEILDRIKNLERVLSDIKIERESKLEALSENTEQLSGPRLTESARHSDKSSMRIQNSLRAFAPSFGSKGSLLRPSLRQLDGNLDPSACADRRSGSVSAPAPSLKPSDKSCLKEWVKKHLQALGRALANFAGKAAAALHGNIGSIVSWLLITLGKTVTYLAENLWSMAIAVGTLLHVTAWDWLTTPQPKRH